MNPSNSKQRIRIYQLLPRLFGNVNETRKPNGTMAENGVGKFDDITKAALASLRAMGFTHLWLTGVMRQATSTGYSAVGLPADDPDLLKGLAGSPYAIKDCFDVCPDYAVNPAERLAEFRSLLARIHDAGMGALIDFVPNHVARSYRSTVMPDLDFGVRDDRTKFFDPRNNYFYLQPDSPGGGPPLKLPTVNERGEFISPTCKVLGKGDGRFAEEMEYGRVTGNNAVTWSPGIHDWYETVKLNYGFDFTTGTRAYPRGGDGGVPLPATWEQMDRVLAYWQAMGVDGFRCDMSHMVPPEFWQWAISRSRMRAADVVFVGEAYDNDPMKVGTGNVMRDLIAAGFDAVYDDPSYKILKGIYDGPKWANDLDEVLADPLLFDRALRYAENHDEVRLAGAGQWGGIGMDVGRPVSAILFGLSRGPVLVYSGQEVGEPARGSEGYGNDDARTTIFDYWSMPELAKWVNGHRYDGGRLSPGQKSLRGFYGRLLALVDEPAFRAGECFRLNDANKANEGFGRVDGETTSGHWLYAYLRFDSKSGQCFVVLVNLHRNEAMRDVVVRLPHETVALFHPPGIPTPKPVECLSETKTQITLAAAEGGAMLLRVAEIPPLTPYYIELRPSGG